MLTPPGWHDLRTERAAFVATVESLDDEQFDSAPTLCEGWAPRDVLAHAVAIDGIGGYVMTGGRIDAQNAKQVAEGRTLDRAELMRRAHRWAQSPPLQVRALAYFLLQDVAVHHEDVLRGLGRRRDIPRPIARAIMREGLVLGLRRLRRYRVVPTDGLYGAMGRGQEVRGSTADLGMWLCGRRSVADALDFS